MTGREAVRIALERGKDAFLRMIGLAAADPGRFVAVAAPLGREKAGSRFAALAGLGSVVAGGGSADGNRGDDDGIADRASPQDVALAAMCATSVYDSGAPEAALRRMRRRLFAGRMLSRRVGMAELREREKERLSEVLGGER